MVLLVRGFGLGGAMIPVMTVAYLDTRPDEVPHASVLTRISQQVGGAFGTAILQAPADERTPELVGEA